MIPIVNLLRVCLASVFNAFFLRDCSLGSIYSNSASLSADGNFILRWRGLITLSREALALQQTKVSRGPLRDSDETSRSIVKH